MSGGYLMAAVHHYVPRLLLKNFCSGDKEQLWACDKRTGRSFFTSVQNVAGERDYYEMKVGNEVISLEPALGDLESRAAVLFDRMVAERSIGWLSGADREVVAAFVAVQMKRGPQIRENFITMDAGLRRFLGERSGLQVGEYPEMTPEMAKAMALASLVEPDQFAEHILDKSWLLFETSSAIPFYISDNPVALQNEDTSRGPHRGNLGLAVRGIQIYLPISSTLVLAFFCRSHESMIRNGVERMRTSMVKDPDMPLGFGPLLDWMRAFRKGTPLSSQADNVLNHNSLQVAQAERFVFCSLPDFGLVTEMVAGNPALRTGRRLQIA